MTTVATIIDAVLRRLEEDSITSPIFYSRAEILTYVSDGFIELVLIGGHLTSERTITLLSSHYIAVPDGAIAPLHLAISDRMLPKKSIEAFDRENPQWSTNPTGTAKGWSPIGLKDIFIDRRVTASGSTAKLTTVDKPPVLTEGTTIDLDAEYIEALEDYAFHIARFKEGGPEFAQSIRVYETFLETAGMVGARTASEDFGMPVEHPSANTGPGYKSDKRS